MTGNLIVPGAYLDAVAASLARDVRAQQDRGEPVDHGVLAVLDGCRAARSGSVLVPMRDDTDAEAAWWPVAESARWAGVSPRAITKARAAGRLRGVMVRGRWLVDPVTLEEAYPNAARAGGGSNGEGSQAGRRGDTRRN